MMNSVGAHLKKWSWKVERKLFQDGVQPVNALHLLVHLSFSSNVQWFNTAAHQTY